MTTMKTTTWAIPQLPVDWVTEHEGKLWIVPARHNGWKAKRPYRGHHPDKIPTAQKSNLASLGTGIPA